MTDEEQFFNVLNQTLNFSEVSQYINSLIISLWPEGDDSDEESDSEQADGGKEREEERWSFIEGVNIRNSTRNNASS